MVRLADGVFRNPPCISVACAHRNVLYINNLRRRINLSRSHINNVCVRAQKAIRKRPHVGPVSCCDAFRVCSGSEARENRFG